MAAKEFDIVVYGATGYTGRLVAEHFVREYGGKPVAPKWAMAGRSKDKLEEVRRERESVPPGEVVGARVGWVG